MISFPKMLFRHSGLFARIPARSPALVRFNATQSSQTDRAEKTLKRFWNKVSLEKNAQDQYQVLLDKRVLKTPSGVPINVDPRRKHIALILAEEWDNQKRVLKPHTLPMTSLVARAVDGLDDPQLRQDVVVDLLKYLDTDTVCYHEEYPQPLVKLQDKHWRPLIDWVQDTFKVKINIHESILSHSQPDATILALGSHVSGYDKYRLAAFERAVYTSKSFILALALVEGRLTIEEAAQAANVEVQSQIDRWGEVEDTHDVDYQDIRAKLGSCSLLVRELPAALAN